MQWGSGLPGIMARLGFVQIGLAHGRSGLLTQAELDECLSLLDEESKAIQVELQALATAVMIALFDGTQEGNTTAAAAGVTCVSKALARPWPLGGPEGSRDPRRPPAPSAGRAHPGEPSPPAPVPPTPP
jgi:hypothetical protein